MAYQGLQYELNAAMPMAVATSLFASLCSAYAPTGALTGSGAPTGAYAAVPGLQNIPCMAAPTSEVRITANEAKSEKEVLATNSSHVLLSGFYPIFPPLAASGWKVIIDGVTYDLLGAESDSQSTQTRLNVRTAQV